MKHTHQQAHQVISRRNAEGDTCPCIVLRPMVLRFGVRAMPGALISLPPDPYRAALARGDVRPINPSEAQVAPRPLAEAPKPLDGPLSASHGVPSHLPTHTKAESEEPPPTPAPRKRGRPRKVKPEGDA